MTEAAAPSPQRDPFLTVSAKVPPPSGEHSAVTLSVKQMSTAMRVWNVAKWVLAGLVAAAILGVGIALHLGAFVVISAAVPHVALIAIIVGAVALAVLIGYGIYSLATRKSAPSPQLDSATTEAKKAVDDATAHLQPAAHTAATAGILARISTPTDTSSTSSPTPPTSGSTAESRTGTPSPVATTRTPTPDATDVLTVPTHNVTVISLPIAEDPATAAARIAAEQAAQQAALAAKEAAEADALAVKAKAEHDEISKYAKTFVSEIFDKVASNVAAETDRAAKARVAEEARVAAEKAAAEAAKKAKDALTARFTATTKILEAIIPTVGAVENYQTIFQEAEALRSELSKNEEHRLVLDLHRSIRSAKERISAFGRESETFVSNSIESINKQLETETLDRSTLSNIASRMADIQARLSAWRSLLPEDAMLGNRTNEFTALQTTLTKIQSDFPQIQARLEGLEAAAATVSSIAPEAFQGLADAIARETELQKKHQEFFAGRVRPRYLQTLQAALTAASAQLESLNAVRISLDELVFSPRYSLQGNIDAITNATNALREQLKTISSPSVNQEISRKLKEMDQVLHTIRSATTSYNDSLAQIKGTVESLRKNAHTPGDAARILEEQESKLTTALTAMDDSLKEIAAKDSIKHEVLAARESLQVAEDIRILQRDIGRDTRAIEELQKSLNRISEADPFARNFVNSVTGLRKAKDDLTLNLPNIFTTRRTDLEAKIAAISQDAATIEKFKKDSGALEEQIKGTSIELSTEAFEKSRLDIESKLKFLAELPIQSTKYREAVNKKIADLRTQWQSQIQRHTIHVAKQPKVRALEALLADFARKIKSADSEADNKNAPIQLALQAIRIKNQMDALSSYNAENSTVPSAVESKLFSEAQGLLTLYRGRQPFTKEEKEYHSQLLAGQDIGGRKTSTQVRHIKLILSKLAAQSRVLHDPKADGELNAIFKHLSSKTIWTNTLLKDPAVLDIWHQCHPGTAYPLQNNEHINKLQKLLTEGDVLGKSDAVQHEKIKQELEEARKTLDGEADSYLMGFCRQQIQMHMQALRELPPTLENLEARYKHTNDLFMILKSGLTSEAAHKKVEGQTIVGRIRAEAPEEMEEVASLLENELSEILLTKAKLQQAEQSKKIDLEVNFKEYPDVIPVMGELLLTELSHMDNLLYVDRYLSEDGQLNETFEKKIKESNLALNPSQKARVRQIFLEMRNAAEGCKKFISELTSVLGLTEPGDKEYIESQLKVYLSTQNNETRRKVHREMGERIALRSPSINLRNLSNLFFSPIFMAYIQQTQRNTFKYHENAKFLAEIGFSEIDNSINSKLITNAQRPPRWELLGKEVLRQIASKNRKEQEESKKLADKELKEQSDLFLGSTSYFVPVINRMTGIYNDVISHLRT